MEVPEHDVLAKDNDPLRFCGICEYIKNQTTCTHEYIVKKFGPTVGFYWCCDFFERDAALSSTAKLLKKAMRKS